MNSSTPLRLTDLSVSRPTFFTPKPVSPTRKQVKDETSLVSLLGKRSFIEAFGEDTSDEERYGQAIGDDFFVSNVGHGVFAVDNYSISVDNNENKGIDCWMTEAHGKIPKGAVGRPSATIPEHSAAIGNVVTNVQQDLDFTAEFLNVPRRQRDCEEKYDVEELLGWCNYYLNNRNLFNV